MISNKQLIINNLKNISQKPNLKNRFYCRCTGIVMLSSLQQKYRMNKLFILLLFLNAAPLTAQPTAGHSADAGTQLLNTDTIRPTVVCFNGVIINIMPTQMVTMWAPDFLQYAQDNVTPANLIQFGLRKSGEGVGFPQGTSITYNCDELGMQLVELWAMDEAGNANFCQVTLEVRDDLGACPAVSANEPDARFGLSVAPNPFSGTLNIGLQTAQSTRFAIRLTDAAGRQVLHDIVVSDAGATTLELPVAELAPGLYFLSLEDASGARRVKRLIKVQP